MKQYSDFRSFSKNQAYWERNQLVAALSKIYPSSLGKHPKSDKSWDKDWRNIAFITIPVRTANRHFPMGPAMLVEPMQLSWHLHTDDMIYFDHLPRSSEKWDGHTTDEKYKRLQHLHVPCKKWWQFWK